MAREIGMTFTLNGNLGTGFRSAFRGAKGQIEGISQAIRDMEKSPTGTLGASMMRQRAQIKEYGASLRVATGQLNGLRARATAAGGATGILKRQIELAEKTVDRLSGQLRRANDGYRTTIAEARNAAGSVRSLSNAYRELSASMGKAHAHRAKLMSLQTKADELRAQRSDMQSRLMTTAASAMTVAAPIKLSVDFEDAMARAGALAKVDQSGLAEMTAQARQLGRDTVFSATQVSEGMQYLAMAGFNKGQIKGAMPGMLDLAAAGKTDLAATADIASNILTPFEIPAERMGHVADVLTTTFTSANTDLLKLGDTMKYVAPVAHELGMSLEETSAVSALMANAGIQGTMAGTAARAGLARLAAPPKMAAQALYQLGVSTKDVAGNMLPVTEILDQLFEKTAKLGNAERAGAFKKIFGEEAFSAWLAVMRQGQKEVTGADGKTTTALRNIVAAYENADGAAARMSEQMNATTGGALRRLKSAWEEVGITVGNFFMPVISGAANFLTNAANAISGFAQRFPVLSQGIAIAAGAFVTLSATGLIAGLAINGMRMGLVKLEQGFYMATAAAKVFGTGLKGALIGTGVGAILVGLGMAAEYVISHWEEIGPALSRVFGPIRETVGGAIDWVRDRFAGFVTFFTGVGPAVASRIGPSIERIRNAFGLAAMFARATWEKVSNFFGNIWNTISGWASGAWQEISLGADAASEWIQSIWSDITGFFSDLWDGVCNLASGAWEWITSTGSACLEGLTMAWSWLSDFFGGLWEGICTTVSSAWDWIATSCEPVATFVTEIWEGVSSFLSGVWDGVVLAAQTCWESIVTVWTPVTDFFSGIVDGIRSVFTGFFEWLAGKFQWVLEVVDWVKGAVGMATGAASDLIEGAKGVGTAIGEGISEAYNDAGLVSAMQGKAREDERRRRDDAQFLAKMAEHRRSVEEKERIESERKRLAREGQNKPRAEWAPPTDPKAGKGGRSRSGGGGSRRGSGASSRSTGTTIVRLAGDNRNFTTQFIPAGAGRAGGAPLPISGVSSSSASGGRQSVSGTGRSTASGASAMPTVSNATAIVAAKPLPVIVQNFPGQKKGVTLEPGKSGPLPVALPQQPIQLSTPASAIPTGTPSPLASTTLSASASATGMRARTAPVMGGLLEGLRGRMSGMISTAGAALRDLPEAATRLVGDLSSDVTSVLPFMGKNGPYLPGNINLPGLRRESAAPVDGGNGTVQVSLHQTFNVGGGNADAIQRRLTALGPEFERMVRRALSDISAQDRRVTYAQ